MDIIVECNAGGIKKGLLHLLEKKMVSLQIAALCHENLQSSYQWRSKLVNYSSLLLAGASFILSTVGTVAGGVNLPLTVVTGLTLVMKGSQQYCDFGEKAKSHCVCYTTAMDLADDIEYIILKNNHTRESLKQALDVYEERIKSFRKTEETIPLAIKHRFLPSS